MRYLGGRAKIAKKLLPVILGQAEGRPIYLEPFLGGGNTFSVVAPHFERALASDAQEDLVLMWQGLLDGSFDPPEHITEDEYAAQRHAPASALRSFVGFGYSFGGKWFGGYAKHSPGHFDLGSPRRAVLKQLEGMRGSTIVHADYRSWPVHAACVVYCDPPYAGTTTYGAVHGFDHEEFWDTARTWAATGAVVLVSEYEAPADFVPVWSSARRATLAKESNARTALEHLFAHESTIAASSPAAA